MLVVVKKPGASTLGDQAGDNAALKEQLLVFLEGKIARCVVSKVSSWQVRDLRGPGLTREQNSDMPTKGIGVSQFTRSTVFDLESGTLVQT